MVLGVFSNRVRPLCCVTELSHKVETDIETTLLHLLCRMASLPASVALHHNNHSDAVHFFLQFPLPVVLMYVQPSNEHDFYSIF